MARLYANENFPLPVVEELRRLGHDVLTVHEAGRAGQSVPDEAILTFAWADGRALLTLNRKHFIRLHNEQPHHAGIIGVYFRSGLRRSGSSDPRGHWITGSYCRPTCPCQSSLIAAHMRQHNDLVGLVADGDASCGIALRLWEEALQDFFSE